MPIHTIVGCSISAEISAFYCAGIPVATLEAEACATRWWETLRLFFLTSVAGGSAGAVPSPNTGHDRPGDRKIEEFRPAFRLRSDRYSHRAGGDPLFRSATTV